MIKRRLFIAINLPEETKSKLVKFQEKWRDLEAKSINWVIKPNLHITLLFLGYMNDDEMYEVCKIMKQVAKRHQPFFINLERIIAGPSNAAPRMFWVEGAKSQELAELQKDLEESIAGRVYFRKENRVYRPHITLARFKYEVAKKLRNLSGVNEPLNTEIPVERIDLMQSNLKRTGPEYVLLESVELGT